MPNNGVMATLQVAESGGLELHLSVSDTEPLQQVCAAFRYASCHDETFDLDGLQFHATIGEIRKVTIGRCPPGDCETIRIDDPGKAVDCVTWQGDGEYWLECAEKCERLLEDAAGHQYLMVRGHHNQMVTLSFREVMSSNI